MAETNKEIVDSLEIDAIMDEIESGEEDVSSIVIRCWSCIHGKSVPGDPKVMERIYCITYDTFKRYDGFCELGCLEEEKEDVRP